MERHLFKLGEDAEVLLQREDGQVVSAIPYFPNGKGNPEPLPCQYGGVIHDGVAIETNTVPAANLGEWMQFNLAVMDNVRERAASHGLKLLFESAKLFPPSELRHPDARELGCSRDFNAWTRRMNPKPDVRKIGCERFIGGHVHFGVGNLSEVLNANLSEMKEDIVCLFEVGVAVPSVLLDNLAGNTSRRKVYGQSGSFRPKHYGVECRSLSPFWKQSPELLATVYGLVEKVAINASKVGGTQFRDYVLDVVDKFGGATEIQRVVNLCDKDEAAAMLRDNSWFFGGDYEVEQLLAKAA